MTKHIGRLRVSAFLSLLVDNLANLQLAHRKMLFPIPSIWHASKQHPSVLITQLGTNGIRGTCHQSTPEADFFDFFRAGLHEQELAFRSPCSPMIWKQLMGNYCPMVQHAPCVRRGRRLRPKFPRYSWDSTAANSLQMAPSAPWKVVSPHPFRCWACLEYAAFSNKIWFELNDEKQYVS